MPVERNMDSLSLLVTDSLDVAGESAAPGVLVNVTGDTGRCFKPAFCAALVLSVQRWLTGIMTTVHGDCWRLESVQFRDTLADQPDQVAGQLEPATLSRVWVEELGSPPQPASIC